MKTSTFATILIASSSLAIGQSSLPARRISAQVKAAGTYHLATGVWSRASGASSLGPDVLYNNSTPPAYFAAVQDDNVTPFEITETGRLPSLSDVGDDDLYTIDGLTFAYCTSLATSLEVRYSFRQSYSPCTTPSTPIASSFTLPGLPTTATTGTQACWFVTVDLSATSFVFSLAADAEGFFDNSASQDDFGYSFAFSGHGLDTTTGPILSGDPLNSPFGDGTTNFGFGPGPDGTGLGQQDAFWIETASLGGPGCYNFGGYATLPWGGYSVSINGDGGLPNCFGVGDKDLCGSAEVIAGVGDFCYDTTLASDSSEAQNTSPCDFGSGNDFRRDVWWDWTAPSSRNFDMSTCAGGNGDTAIAAYSGQCSSLQVIGCDDDTCGTLSSFRFFAVKDQVYKLRLGGAPAGGSPLGPGAGRFSLSVPGAGLFTGYCIAASNSVDPGGARASAIGSASVSLADLTLFAGPVPNQPGLFYYGPNQIQIPFGNGFRCVGGNVVRLPVIFASSNVLTHVVDVGANGPNFLTLGAVNFQAWYRDPADGGALFNLSDAIQIVFVP